MSDRELLELAVIAADIKGEYALIHQTYGDIWVDGINTGAAIFWNPLTDDGDALRLANKLRMRVEHHVSHPFVAVFVGYSFYRVKVEEPVVDDVNEATRRAIVRAAAELGRSRCYQKG